LSSAFEAFTQVSILKEATMRQLSTAAVATILAIAFYFAIYWGYEALGMLASPSYGLEEVWRSQFIFEIGRLFALSPLGLIKLAAFFAVLKLAVAGICAVHVFARLRALADGVVKTEIFEAGMVLVALISAAALGSAIWSHNGDVVRVETVQLVLAGVGAGLSIIERRYSRGAEAVVPMRAAMAAPQNAVPFSPFR
jgi:hypothetical protein